MNNKIKILALFGKAGAGKDYLQKHFVDEIGYDSKIHGIVSATTRPPREGEIPGRDYIFLNIEEFGSKVLDGTMLEATTFRDWCYGTPIEALDPTKINIGVFNINGIEALLDNPDLIVQPVFIKASDKTRLIRQLNRENDPDIKEIFRRYKADEEDFLDIPFSYKVVYNDYAFLLNNTEPIIELKEIIEDLDKIV